MIPVTITLSVEDLEAVRRYQTSELALEALSETAEQTGNYQRYDEAASDLGEDARALLDRLLDKVPTLVWTPVGGRSPLDTVQAHGRRGWYVLERFGTTGQWGIHYPPNVALPAGVGWTAVDLDQAHRWCEQVDRA